MTHLENYIHIAEGLDALTVRAEQLHALSRVIEDANATPDRDAHSVQTALWLLSSLTEEHNSALSALQKKFFERYRP